jgi:4-cresol dehydrogenase (hydroxylating)
VHDAPIYTQRAEWYQGPGSIPDAVSKQIMQRYNIGWWSFRVALFGDTGAVEAHARVARRALNPTSARSSRSAPAPRPADREIRRARPNVLALQIINWFGGRGGMGFSPVMPPDGGLALEQFHSMARFEQHGSTTTSFTLGQRHISNMNLILYNRDDADRWAGRARY